MHAEEAEVEVEVEETTWKGRTVKARTPYRELKRSDGLQTEYSCDAERLGNGDALYCTPHF